MTAETTTFEGWAILELMGHRKLAGHVSEEQLAGAAFIRIDVPLGGEDEPATTQFYSPAAVYCITPTTEELARQVAASRRPEPVSRFELPRAPEPPIEEADVVELRRDGELDDYEARF